MGDRRLKSAWQDLEYWAFGDVHLHACTGGWIDRCIKNYIRIYAYLYIWSRPGGPPHGMVAIF